MQDSLMGLCRCSSRKAHQLSHTVQERSLSSICDELPSFGMMQVKAKHHAESAPCTMNEFDLSGQPQTGFLATDIAAALPSQLP